MCGYKQDCAKDVFSHVSTDSLDFQISKTFKAKASKPRDKGKNKDDSVERKAKPLTKTIPRQNLATGASFVVVYTWQRNALHNECQMHL